MRTRCGSASRLRNSVEHLGLCSRWAYWTKRLPDPERHRRERAERDRPAAHRIRRLSSSETVQLADWYRAGSSVYELAAQFQVHRVTVSKCLREQGVRMRGQGLSLDQQEQATGLYASGLSLARIGDRFGVEAHTVRSALLRRGVAMRDSHGRER